MKGFIVANNNQETIIILQSHCKRRKEDIEEMEAEYSKKLNTKVVILDSDLSLETIQIQSKDKANDFIKNESEKVMKDIVKRMSEALKRM